jgi:16S rRNA (guanine(966)-N(2))-methyltransferase RsmD
VRVVAGTYGGRRLVAPRGTSTRPTSDRVREALFSILFDVESMRVLDLFAGTGAIGIEALSRGASSAAFVEDDRRALTALRKNLDSLRIQEPRARVYAERVERTLDLLFEKGETFDLIFADPPYRDAPRALPEVLRQSGRLLEIGGRIVLELSDDGLPPDAPMGLALERVKRYGDTVLAFYDRVK